MEAIGASQRVAASELTMLTSDTMSMLAMSMLMPTSTGAPVGETHTRAELWVGVTVNNNSTGGGGRYLRSQAAGGCRSPSAACPRSLSRRTCCWVRSR